MDNIIQISFVGLRTDYLTTLYEVSFYVAASMAGRSVHDVLRIV
jgi:hypothetical protein